MAPNNENNTSTEMRVPPLMRTVVYGKTIGTYAARTEVSVPKPKRNQVLVRVHAVGLNPVDAKVVVGDKLPHDWTTVRGIIHEHNVRGHIPGFDFAGTVVDASRQTRYAVGTPVFGTMPPLEGSLAEYIAAPLDQICEMPRQSSGQNDTPSTNDFVRAASLPLVGLTALQCIKPHIQNRPSVLVIGASGGTGHVALQVAQCLGAAHVTAVCSGRSFDFCRQKGATEVVDYHTSDLVAALRQTPGAPFDFVMDCVTSDDPRDTASVHYPSLLQSAGSSLLSGNYVYRRLGGKTTDWMRAGLQRVLAGGAGGPNGSFFWWKFRGTSREQLFWIRFPESSGELEELRDWANEGKLQVSVEQVHEFSESGVQAAMDAILSRRVRGKVVVQLYPALSNQEA